MSHSSRDWFEEAVTPHHLFGDLGDAGVGLDISPAVAQAAAGRIAGSVAERTTATTPARIHRCSSPILRALPFASASLARILSGSSLDHFKDKAEIAGALAELERALGPGGCLVVTFDNPHNPIVRLRNGLPFHWLRAIRLVPYFVGAMYDRTDIEREFTALGLRITSISAIAQRAACTGHLGGVAAGAMGTGGVSQLAAADLPRLRRTGAYDAAALSHRVRSAVRAVEAG